jgi:hypothetical protein
MFGTGEASMMFVHSVCFAVQKQGSTAREYEDGAGFADGDPAAGRDPRFVVVDGATEAYDALRWVAQLVTSFLGQDNDADGDGNGGTVALAPGPLRDWFATMQHRWVALAPRPFANVIEEYKFHAEGSFATFLGVELTGLDSAAAGWTAAALGDTVLFHVRAGNLLTHFPPIDVDEFGLAPDGAATRPAALEQMMRGLLFGRGRLRPGDLLFVATDAFAHWMLGQVDRDQATLWAVLAGLDHDATFAALVAGQRAAGLLRNDDVTLLRVRIAAAQPGALVVCL